MLNIFGDELDEVQEEQEYKRPAAPSLFDWLNNITNGKNNELERDQDLRGFEPYIIAKGLGQGEGTLGFANLMNQLPNIPKRYQYLFYLHGIPKHKAYNKWAKSSHDKNLKPFMEVTGLTKEKALDALRVLTSEQIKAILTDPNSKTRKRKKK